MLKIASASKTAAASAQIRTLLVSMSASSGKTSKVMSHPLEQIAGLSLAEELVSSKNVTDFDDFAYGGRGGFRSMRPMLYASCQSAIFIVTSSTDLLLLDESGDELKQLMEDRSLSQAAVLVLVVKTASTTLDSAQEIDISQRLKLDSIQNRPWKYQMVDSLNSKDEKLRQALTWLTERAAEKVQEAAKASTGDQKAKYKQSLTNTPIEKKAAPIQKKQSLFSRLISSSSATSTTS